MSYRTDCLIRDAVISAMADFVSYWFIAQFFGLGYHDVARFCFQHRRRVRQNGYA